MDNTVHTLTGKMLMTVKKLYSSLCDFPTQKMKPQEVSHSLIVEKLL